MERMSPLDATFLDVEDGIAHMTIASCAVFEGPIPPYGDLVRLIAGKLPLVPRYRQKVRFVPFSMGRPVWVDDPHFDLDYHIRHTALPPPGAERDLRALMARLMEHELDRSRPLWESWVVEGLENGTWALISKVHHCMVDGVQGSDLISVILDADRNAVPLPADLPPAEPEPSGVRLLLDAAVERFTTPARQIRGLASGIRSPRRAARTMADVAHGFRSYARDLRATPPTSIDGGIGPHRRWGWASTTLDDVRAVRAALGGTVNDVVLAAITRGFRDLALSRQEQPDGVRLRSLVPVSVRRSDQRGQFTNLVSAMFAELPIHLEDPVERLEAIRSQLGQLKDSHEADAGQVLTAVAELLPPVVVALGLRAGVRLLRRRPQHMVNTVTTNVPGPQVPLYFAGREMLEYLPYVPLSYGVRVGVAIISYNGRIVFGVTGDYDTVPDIDVVCDGIQEGMAELVKAATPAAA